MSLPDRSTRLAVLWFTAAAGILAVAIFVTLNGEPAAAARREGGAAVVALSIGTLLAWGIPFLVPVALLSRGRSFIAALRLHFAVSLFLWLALIASIRGPVDPVGFFVLGIAGLLIGIEAIAVACVRPRSEEADLPAIGLPVFCGLGAGQILGLIWFGYAAAPTAMAEAVRIAGARPWCIATLEVPITAPGFFALRALGIAAPNHDPHALLYIDEGGRTTAILWSWRRMTWVGDWPLERGLPIPCDRRSVRKEVDSGTAGSPR